MERFKDGDQRLESHPEDHWEPVQLMQEKCHVGATSRAHNHPHGRILDQLEPLSALQREPHVESITVVQPGGDKGVGDHAQGVPVQKDKDTPNPQSSSRKLPCPENDLPTPDHITTDPRQKDDDLYDL